MGLTGHNTPVEWNARTPQGLAVTADGFAYGTVVHNRLDGNGTMLLRNEQRFEGQWSRGQVREHESHGPFPSFLNPSFLFSFFLNSFLFRWSAGGPMVDLSLPCRHIGQV